MKTNNPTAKGGAVEKPGSNFRDLSTLSAFRIQHLIGAHAVRPEWAKMMASAVFGEAC